MRKFAACKEREGLEVVRDTEWKKKFQKRAKARKQRHRQRERKQGKAKLMIQPNLKFATCDFKFIGEIGGGRRRYLGVEREEREREREKGRRKRKRKR